MVRVKVTDGAFDRAFDLSTYCEWRRMARLGKLEHTPARLFLVSRLHIGGVSTETGVVWSFILESAEPSEGLTSEETLASPHARRVLDTWLKFNCRPTEQTIARWAAARWPHFLNDEPLDSAWRQHPESPVHGRMLLSAFGIPTPP